MGTKDSAWSGRCVVLWDAAVGQWRRAAAQDAAKPVITTTPEVLNFAELAQQGKALLEKARAGSGSAGITLANYKGHYTMLTARTGERRRRVACTLLRLSDCAGRRRHGDDGRNNG